MIILSSNKEIFVGISYTEYNWHLHKPRKYTVTFYSAERNLSQRKADLGRRTMKTKSTYYAFLSLLLLLFSMAKYNTSSPVYREYYLLSRHYPLLLVFTRLNLPLGISLWEYDSNCSVLWYIDNYKMTCVSPKFLSSQWKSNFLGLSQSCSLSYLVYTLFTFEYKKKLDSELNGCFSDRGT